MEIFMGTSGWRYFWNKGGSLDWYILNSGLNAIELNSSFYRFPYKNMIKSWINKGSSLRWCVKVHRLITHIHKFNYEAKDIFKRFIELFTPMEKLIDFYLFQLPPKSTPDNTLGNIEKFFDDFYLENKIALEVRNIEWFKKEYFDWVKSKNITFVSIDSPKLPRDIIKTSDTIYIRFHGREGWYEHYYTEDELIEIKSRIIKEKPKKIYAFFNNDKDMLENAKLFKELFKL